MPKILLIDNHDSFTYNLVQLIVENPGYNITVAYPEEIDKKMVMGFDKIMISPGPGMPAERPFLKQLFTEPLIHKSILGICLGHQAVWESFGGKLFNLESVQHGIRKKIRIVDKEDTLFRGLDDEIEVGLYHSWAADPHFIPECLRITALSIDGIIMGISHNKFDIKGIQFHPESFMTDMGRIIIRNWLEAGSCRP